MPDQELTDKKTGIAFPSNPFLIEQGKWRKVNRPESVRRPRDIFINEVYSSRKEKVSSSFSGFLANECCCNVRGEML